MEYILAFLIEASVEPQPATKPSITINEDQLKMIELFGTLMSKQTGATFYKIGDTCIVIAPKAEASDVNDGRKAFLEKNPLNLTLPPIGLRPKFIWIEHRIDEIKQAIERYLEARTEIPVAWFEEYAALIEQLKEKK